MKTYPRTVIASERSERSNLRTRIASSAFGFLAMTILFTNSPLVFAGDTVKLRVVAVNPSAEKTQTVPIKIYLPKEVIPDDIINMGELKVGYDSEKGLYFAFSDGVDLAPQETRVFEVQLEDVWRVKDEEVEKIKTQTNRALKHLEHTEFYDQAKNLVDSIDKRMDEIATKQDDDSVSREEHIGTYRTNLVTMGQIKNDIATLEKLLQHTGAPPSIEFLKDTVFEQKKDMDKITAWKLILAIVGFLALLGFGFYMKWIFAVKTKRGPKLVKDRDSAPRVGEHAEDRRKISAMEGSEEPEEIDIEKLMEPEDKDKREAG